MKRRGLLFFAAAFVAGVALVTGSAVDRNRSFAAEEDAGPPAPTVAGCRLAVEFPKSVGLKEWVPAKVTIVNGSSQTLQLVEPGDGSDCGWRTPIVGWSVLPGDSPRKHPPTPRKDQTPRCGNVNPLQKSEVFELRPGENRKLGEWTGGPIFTAPGEYRVVFYYVNRPALEWRGIPLGKHDEATMARVRGSTPLVLKSDEFRVVVTE